MTEQQAIDILWNYHHMGHTPTPSDLIFILGSNDVRVAQYAAELYHQGIAPLLLFSGGTGRFTGEWSMSEAELFASAAINCGVPENALLIENKSTNTGENIRFSRAILEQRGLPPSVKLVALQKPYMERRTFAALKKQWSEADILISSPPLSFSDYLHDELPRELVISAITGDFQRIIEYPSQGFAIEQPFSQETLDAFRTLVDLGFTSQLIPGIPLPWERSSDNKRKDTL